MLIIIQYSPCIDQFHIKNKNDLNIKVFSYIVVKNLEVEYEFFENKVSNYYIYMYLRNDELSNYQKNKH